MARPVTDDADEPILPTRPRAGLRGARGLRRGAVAGAWARRARGAAGRQPAPRDHQPAAPAPPPPAPPRRPGSRPPSRRPSLGADLSSERMSLAAQPFYEKTDEQKAIVEMVRQF